MFHLTTIDTKHITYTCGSQKVMLNIDDNIYAYITLITYK